MRDDAGRPVNWVSPEDPDAFVRQVLAQEAGEIPQDLIDQLPWSQQFMVVSELRVDEAMVVDHDRQLVHCLRRDGFVDVEVLSADHWPRGQAASFGRE